MSHTLTNRAHCGPQQVLVLPMAAAWLLLLASPITSCKNQALCKSSEDCADHLVCAEHKCRTTCSTTDDCPEQTSCLVGVCLPTERSCVTHQDCLSLERCLLGRCRTLCNVQSDCGSGACLQGFCFVDRDAASADHTPVDRTFWDNTVQDVVDAGITDRAIDSGGAAHDHWLAESGTDGPLEDSGTVQEAGGADAGMSDAGLADITAADATRTDAGASIFIDPSNSSDPLENGSAEHPFDSWADVQWNSGYSYLQKRGTITVEGLIQPDPGLTQIELGAFGTGSRPIIISTVTGGGDRHAINLCGISSSIIRDLEISGPTAVSGIRLECSWSSDLSISDLKVRDTQYGIRAIDGFTGLTISNVEITDVSSAGFYGDVNQLEFAHSLVESPQSGISLDHHISSLNIHHNIVSLLDGADQSCISISGENTAARGQISHNICIGQSNQGSVGILLADNVSSVDVLYNRVRNVETAVVSLSLETKLAYNIITHSTVGAHVRQACSIYNNVFYHVDTAINAGSDRTRIKNNIFLLQDLDATAVVHGHVDQLESNHNLYYPMQPNFLVVGGTGYASLADYFQATEQGFDSLDVDPMFENAEGDNFHLQTDSPAINQGEDVGLNYDYEGAQVPQGTAVDLGVFEER